MWTEGSIKIGDAIVHYWVKHYDAPSKEYGINGGRISKLSLKQNGVWVANYDRGWDLKPATKEAETALAILLDEYK